MLQVYSSFRLIFCVGLHAVISLLCPVDVGSVLVSKTLLMLKKQGL